MARPGPTGVIRVHAGATSTSTSCRFGATDLIEVRRNVTADNPEGDYDLARLPRSAVSTPPPATVPPTPPPVGFTWDDAFLPIVGTKLQAKPAANAGGGRGYLVIDGTTLRPNTV